ncbi:MAG TPA: carbon starvation protein A [Bacteroidales bacterium]|nr:MAG: carbon starvation protein CstA [Bacteroidetes bacterium GWE2_42_24]PKP27248.1 MAG: carbon starvation protein A [Bacteroidetes bacterium HGW-Bacteroidetes-22]HBZ67809.1 carbon starvation protein A [Bacteroidales bacterium]
MITFLAGVVLLIAGYLIYGKIIERVFGVDSRRATPAIATPDGVDFIPLKWGKIFLIQFLNIAGLGPIFGAVMGAVYGPVVFIWIAVGTIFGGAVHDYFSGMLSVRHNGGSIGEVVGTYLGNGTKQFMRLFTVILMIFVGAVFVTGPAEILSGMTQSSYHWMGLLFWGIIIVIYYILATLLPVDQIIGRIYPFFGVALLFMAVGVIITLFTSGKIMAMPELFPNGLINMKSNATASPIFPMLFITVACGAISGFHSTQAPLMARCITNESLGRRVFYGAMVAEGLVAMVWAAAGMSFYGGVEGLNEMVATRTPASIVSEICNSMLGTFGGILALIGVVAAPITSGDTAFRSGRLIVADFLNFKQFSIRNRLIISIPLFAAGLTLTQLNFEIIWRYFGWANQTLAVIVLWTITVYLWQAGKLYWLTLIPALFMTAVVTTYILIVPTGFGLSHTLSYIIGIGITAIFGIYFAGYTIKNRGRWLSREGS